MAFKREQVIGNAEKFVSRGKLDAAIKEYHKVLQDNPSDTSTLNRLGDLYARQSRTPEAVRLFTQTAEHYAADGFLVKSIAIYKKIIRLEPRRIEINGKLAELYARQGLVNDARSHYQSLVDHHLRQSDTGAAIGVLQQMTELEPENPSHQLRLAELFLQEGLDERAVLAYRSIAELMLQHDRVEEAVRVFRRAFEVRTDDLGFLAEALGLLRRGRHLEAADHLLVAAVELNPEASSLAAPADAAPTAPSAPEDEVAVTDRADDVAPTLPGRSAGEGRWDDSGSFEPPDLPGVDDDVFVLDVDDDVSASLVAPPAGMTEPGEAFGGPAAAAPVGAAAAEQPAPAAEPPGGDEMASLPQLDEPGFELELEDEEPAAPPRAVAPPAAAPPRPAEPVPAPPPEPEPPRLQDLVAEAEVFAKYGLEEKARERAEQILARSPGHLEGLRLLLDLRLRAGDAEGAGAAAARLRSAAVDQGRPDAWETVRPKLEAAGVVVASLPPAVAEPGPAPEPAPPPPAEAPAATEGTSPQARRRPALRVEDALAQLTSEILERPARRRVAPETAAAEPPPAAAAAAPPSPAPPPGAPPAAPPPARPVRPSDWGELDDELPDVVLPQERMTEEPSLDDTDMGWLDEAPAPAAAPIEEKLFEDEDEFFDLAAELEEELEKEDVGLADQLPQPEEPSLEEIVEGFKRGVAENLGAEDYDTHYNLGIAYREMGLLDEAIGEFQVAAKDSRYLVDCCSMLGLCFLEKGLPELAVKWYRRGLEQEGLAEDTTLSLLYELGDAYVAAGDETAARRTFVELYGLSSGYRDVSARVAELGG